ncbi:MAG TPA: T9SS type A sorting domain-containing protein [Candidatus Hydrothermia bacterium]|nr:T9SS type A sorting domain-containing protein [Candidatus Hydrothermae bacterium]MDD3649417.1 T9SS type A sorting domain-containing protein [Candidatus Hydrothermia bacterium]MDD5573041.1 T9SS type A sorting domain-containing protein [Candidatus Hydrothermia bacterium]HOK22865.1 T9SS type A sorting domain-containing protein [Candidatus Hydrothermia bacterium]HOL23574.1 T9SS type A sorting domain-containing protein [Candidatus Hydrothermia bacterium]
MRKFRVFATLILGIGVVFAAPVVDGTVNPDVEGYTLVAENAENTDKAGADLLAFYYAVSSESLYLAITTQNSASWGVAYGFVLDAIDGGYSGDPTGTGDSWGRRLHFPVWQPDYQIYFWYSGEEDSITSNDFNKYVEGSWQYDFATFNYAASISTNGLQSLEVAIPLESLGNPEAEKACAYIVGGDNSSAVDILPYDETVSLTGGDAEWTDWDTITTYHTLSTRENIAKLTMQPILNGVRLTGNGTFNIEVYSVDGRKVLTRRVTVNGSADVQFGGLKSGLYLVREKNLGTSKFIVVK